MGEQGKAEWYSNKELYEMQVTLSKKMETLSSELGKTQVLIRDYNGLRGRLDDCEKKIEQVMGAGTGKKDMWGYLVGGIGILMALISYAVR